MTGKVEVSSLSPQVSFNFFDILGFSEKNTVLMSPNYSEKETEKSERE